MTETKEKVKKKKVVRENSKMVIRGVVAAVVKEVDEED